jgi:hypothetical protein
LAVFAIAFIFKCAYYVIVSKDIMLVKSGNKPDVEPNLVRLKTSFTSIATKVTFATTLTQNNFVFQVEN